MRILQTLSGVKAMYQHLWCGVPVFARVIMLVVALLVCYMGAVFYNFVAINEPVHGLGHWFAWSMGVFPMLVYIGMLAWAYATNMKRIYPNDPFWKR